MSWLSKFIDKRSGANNAINVQDQQDRYSAAMKGTNAGYSDMMGMAKDQMNINSDSNQAKFAMMNQSSQDNAAENARLAMRTSASAGGAPAAAMAFQQQDMANKAQGAVTDQFQQGMFQQQEQGMSSMGGILANQGQIAQSGFNMGESALEYNKKVEADAMTRKMGMLGGALKIGGGLLSQNPMMAMGGAQQMLAQEGGPVGYNEGGQVEEEDPENPKPLGNGESDKDSMLRLAMEAQKRKDSDFMYWENVDGYEDMRAGEKFKGMVKGTLAGNVVGGILGSAIPGIGLPATIAGGLYGRYKAGKRYEEENEGGFNAEDRARVKEIRERRKNGYQEGGKALQGYQEGGQEGGKASRRQGYIEELRQGMERAKTESNPFNPQPLFNSRYVEGPQTKIGAAMLPHRRQGGLQAVTPQENNPISDSFQTRGYQTGGMPKYSPYPGDQIDAKLEPGEYVLNRNAVNAVGKENLDELNNKQAPRFDKNKVKLRMGGYLYGN